MSLAATIDWQPAWLAPFGADAPALQALLGRGLSVADALNGLNERHERHALNTLNASVQPMLAQATSHPQADLEAHLQANPKMQAQAQAQAVRFVPQSALPQQFEKQLQGANGTHLSPPSLLPEEVEPEVAVKEAEAASMSQFSPSSAGAFENLREMLGKLRQAAPAAPERAAGLRPQGPLRGAVRGLAGRRVPGQVRFWGE